MPLEPTDEDNWNSCPSGLISQTAEHHLETPVRQIKRQRRNALSYSLLIATLLTLVSYVLIEAQPVPPDRDATVSCKTVQSNLAAFCNNQIQEVSLERAIGKHLFDCQHCRQMYRSTCRCSNQCPHRKREAITKPWHNE